MKELILEESMGSEEELNILKAYLYRKTVFQLDGCAFYVLFFKFRFSRLLFCVLFMLVLIASCTKQSEEDPDEIILVKIGDKTISDNEFIYRAEFTIRPPYCKGNTYIHKKIILNSLIAEKLMALEAGEDNDFINNTFVKDYLRGRKEQAMRQWQFDKEVSQKVALDTTEMNKVFKMAGRKYKVAYVMIEDSTFAKHLSAVIDSSNKSFEDLLLDEYLLDEITEREVNWSETKHDVILDALFIEPVQKDQVIGPLQTGLNQFILMKIIGWTDQPAITDNQVRTRWQNISVRFKRRQSKEIYNDYILKIMKGKKIEFVAGTFFKIADLLAPVYLKTKKEKNEILQRDHSELRDDENKYLGIRTRIESLYPEPFFKLDGKTWTVQEFSRELRIHPLVFRKGKVKNKRFAEQLKFAIIDMITDRYLADAAYEAGYDQINAVQRDVKMWKDNLNALYHKANYLKSIGEDSTFASDYINVIRDHLNIYIDSLQLKYGYMIEINTDEFEKIELTSIDLVATQPDLPFPMIVPTFPIITTDTRLDYGKK